MLRNYDSASIDAKLTSVSRNKKFILAVVNKLTIILERKLLPNEIEGLVRYIEELDFSLMKNDSLAVIIENIANSFVQQLAPDTRRSKLIDTHEIMKRQIGTIRHDGDESIHLGIECAPHKYIDTIQNSDIQGDKGQNSKYENFTEMRAKNTDETNRVYIDGPSTFAQSGISDVERMFSPMLDKYPMTARQRVQNIYLLLDSKYRNLSTDKSVFKWTVLNSVNTTQGTVNTLSDRIHNVINMQFDRFNLPYVPSADNIYKKISLHVEEFSSMAVLINSGRRYHMMFDTEKEANLFRLTPQINDEGRFRFHTPINVLDTITLKFQSPFTPVEFLQDRFNVVITPLNPTQSILTFSVPHQVVDGELVHIEDFNTLNPSIDDPSNIAVCFIASRRLIIPLRMEYIV
jgi:hypothetical protein